jgi:hypothetical protein
MSFHAYALGPSMCANYLTLENALKNANIGAHLLGRIGVSTWKQGWKKGVELEKK